MGVTIADNLMVSDSCADRAYSLDGESWYVTGYPGREFDRNRAITAMMLADALAVNPPAEDRVWYAVASWREELGLDPDTGRPQ